MIGVIKGTMRQKKEVNGLPLPIASYKANMKAPIRSLKVAITAQQSGSGTPAPDNIRPISGVSECNVGRCGKNFFSNTSPITGKYLNASGIEASYSGWNISDYIPIKAGETYHFNPNSAAGSTAKGFFYTSNTSDSFILSSMFYSGEMTITAPNEAKYVRFSYRTESSDIQLEIGSTATAYEAYTGNTYTIQLGDTYYGGELDVTNGVLRVTHEIVDLGDLNWLYQSGNGTYFYAPLSTMKPVPNSTTLGNALCEQYAIVTARDFVNSPYPNNTFAVNNSSSYPILIRNTSYTDATAFKTAISGVQLVYPLATPITVQLTPTQIEQLLGTNNVFADTGDVEELEYTDRQVYYGK